MFHTGPALTVDKHKVILLYAYKNRIYGKICEWNTSDWWKCSWNMHGQYDFGYGDGQYKSANKCSYDLLPQDGTLDV